MASAFPLFARSGLYLSIALGCTAPALANPLTQAAHLDNVTVFLRGAELFNSSRIALPAGESEVVFTNVATGLNAQSLMVEADNGVVVQSTGVRRDFLSENLSPEVEALKKQREDVGQEKQRLEARRAVIQAQLDVLENNRAMGGESASVSVEQVNQMLQLVGSKMDELLLADIQLRQQLEEVEKNLTRLTSQLEEAQQKNERAVNQVLVKFYSDKAVTANVRLSYVVNDAGWVPTYDVRVDSISGPVQLGYKADVYQNSGINWDKVKLTLSSGNPSEGAQAPTIAPWYIDLQKETKLGKSSAGWLNSESLDEAAPPRPAPVPMEMPAGRMVADERSKMKRSLPSFVITDAGGVNTRFSISLPYNIASDGKAHSVLVKQSEVKGNYRYVSVPKREQNAFLQVQLQDWEKLNLLPGRSNVFFEGSFVGQGQINPRNIQDTLDISLGRDKKILIKREDERLTTDKAALFGNTSSRKYVYGIEVKNTRAEPITLNVLDQIPLSRNSAVTVEELKYGGAEYNKDSGEVSWKLELKPGESRKMSFGYTVKFPQNERVSGL